VTPRVQVGITLGRINPTAWENSAVLADELGYESVWISDHLVIPTRLDGNLDGKAAADKLSAQTPLFDPPSYLSYLAARTERVKLGTLVYLLALRHPFVTARGFATLDQVSGGRALAGVGAGWLRSEFEAAGIDPATRGSRLEEAIRVVRSLWTEETIRGDGPRFPFEEVGFEPKPVQSASIPILVGGESRRALSRAATLGDGWLGMWHDPASAARRVGELREIRAASDRAGEPFQVTVLSGRPDLATLAAFAEVGVDRVIVTPWNSTRQVEPALRSYAVEIGLS
jgi:probable F420-dependent oxidoreductase